MADCTSDCTSDSPRFCFQVPATIMICLNADSELAAWAAMRTWLVRHSCSLINADGERIPDYEMSQVECRLPEGCPADHSTTLVMKCHEVEVIGRSVSS